MSVFQQRLEQEKLCNAACDGDVKAVRQFVETKHVDANGTFGGWTALHGACRYGHVAVVKYLVVEAKADVHIADMFREHTALHLACQRCHTEIVQCLVEAGGANIEARSSDGNTPLHYAAGAGPGGLDIVRYLVVQRKASVGAKNRFGRTPLQEALWYGHVDSIKTFPIRCLSSLDDQGRLPIHQSLESQNPSAKSASIVSLLVERQPKSSLARDPTTGWYPYEAAALIQDAEHDVRWLDVVYTLFRCNPEYVLRSRGIVLGSISSCERFNRRKGMVEMPTTAKRHKSHHQLSSRDGSWKQ